VEIDPSFLEETIITAVGFLFPLENNIQHFDLINTETNDITANFGKNIRVKASRPLV